MDDAANTYQRLLKLARTIIDLAGSEEIQSAHLAEALHATQSSEVDDGVIEKPIFLITGADLFDPAPPAILRFRGQFLDFLVAH